MTKDEVTDAPSERKCPVCDEWFMSKNQVPAPTKEDAGRWTAVYFCEGCPAALVVDTHRPTDWDAIAEFYGKKPYLVRGMAPR